MVTRAFLNKKASKKFYNRWTKGESICEAGTQNICVISDNVYCFTVHNLLPSNDNDILSGHYDFYVNLKTFEYCIYKSSNYGSLDYTIPLSEPPKMLTADELPKNTREIVEAYIANKMVDAYYGSYPSNVYLFGKKEPFRYGSHISDYRKNIWSDLKPNKRSEMDLLALKLIDKDFQQDSFDSIEYVGKMYITGDWYYNQTKTMVKLQAIIKTKLGKEYSILYHTATPFRKPQSYFFIGEIINGDKNNIIYDCKYLLNSGLSEIYKKLPEIIESF